MVLGQVPLCAPGYLAANRRRKWQPINYSLGLFIDHHLWQIGTKCSYPERSSLLLIWEKVSSYKLFINSINRGLCISVNYSSTSWLVNFVMSWATSIKTNIEAGSSLEFPRWLHSFQSCLVSIAWHKLSTFTLFCFRGCISPYHHIHEGTAAQFLEYFESNAWRLFSTLITMAHLLFCLVSSSHPPPGWFRLRVCISPDSPGTQSSDWKDQRNRWRRTTWGRYSTILPLGLTLLTVNSRPRLRSLPLSFGDYHLRRVEPKVNVQCTVYTFHTCPWNTAIRGIQGTCHVVSTKCHMITP